MQIHDLKELRRLIRLCREMNIKGIEVDNIKFELSAIPNKSNKIAEILAPEADIKVPTYNGISPGSNAGTGSSWGQSVIATVDTPDVIDTEELSDDQLLYYSARPEVGDQ